MVVYVFNPSTLEAEVGDLCEFKVTIVYIASSKTVFSPPTKKYIKQV